MAVNAGLAAVAAQFTGVYVFDTTALLGLADVNSSGNHPNGGGYFKWGTALAEFVLERARCAEAGTALRRRRDGPDESGRRVTVDERPPRHHVVDVALAIDVLDDGTASTSDEEGFGPDR